jgi:hypothetical protein
MCHFAAEFKLGVTFQAATWILNLYTSAGDMDQCEEYHP